MASNFLKFKKTHNFAVIFIVGLFSLAALRIIYVCTQIIKGEIYPFAISEWLINYSNGFIRRGLVGSLYILFFPDGKAGLSLLLIVGLILLTFPALYALVWLHKSGYQWANVLLVCNPAAFLFASWDTGGFLRKESIGLTALTTLAIASANRQSQLKRLILILLSLILYFIAVFSSEINCFLVPCFIYLIYGLNNKGLSQLWCRVTIGLFTVTSSSGLLIGALFPGSSSFRSPVCDSIVAKSLSDAYCGGAINLIGFSIRDYFLLVTKHFPTNTLYFFLFLPLALFPIFFTSWAKKNRLFLLSFGIIVVPLFTVALDYGRTIAMFMTGVTLCLMANSRGAKTNINWTGMMVIPFVTLWGLPGYLGPHIKSFPWLGPFEWIVTKVTQ